MLGYVGVGCVSVGYVDWATLGWVRFCLVLVEVRVDLG